MNTTKIVKQPFCMEKDKYAGNLCKECGISANVLTCLKRYHDRPNKLCFDVSTYHIGICAFCGEEKLVTQQRDYFYPDLSLLARAKKGFSLKTL